AGWRDIRPSGCSLGQPRGRPPNRMGGLVLAGGISDHPGV
ncbi:MAG: hypothetical protein AVDCRST_MAG87-2635, partial [uncultured Thermomicrobiales bacterium]